VNDQVAANNSGGGVSGSGGSGAGSEDYFKKYEQLGFYFGNDFPQPRTAPNYSSEYNRYTSTENRALYSRQPNGTQLDEFFNTVVTPNYEVAKQFAIDLAEQIKNSEPNTQVTVYIDSSCSAPQTVEYNKSLSARRIASVIRFFNENPATSKYIKEQRLMVLSGTGFGEQTTSQPKKSKKTQGPFSIDELVVGDTVNCTDNDGRAVGGDTQSVSREIFTTTAMACRRAYVSSIKSNLKIPPPVLPPKKTTVVTGNVVTTTETQTQIENVAVVRDNITKRVLRSLLSECDYFEVIKEETPMVYDNLKDKIKFFQPAFHSTTPEGLNTRLTFLQQCMRPGDTIPVVKSVGGKDVLEYNNATNTAFGTPPVLILRVGDFYNTKIIPTSLSLAYENLDINPEGIGIQPMIAKVTLAFNFVGGSGLKESVDKLQNALTFNYYANTEIYDDRADVTDTSYQVIDKDFLQFAALSGVAPPMINNAAPNNGQTNESTIGSVISSSVTESGETGTISYKSFMDGVVSESQTYFTNVVNKNRESVNQYNNALRQQWMLERNYSNGKISETALTDTILFGKPVNTERRINDIFDELLTDIRKDDEGFIKFMTSPNQNFSNKIIRQLKENYTNVVRTKSGTYQNAITTITQGMTNVQQSYVKVLARANTVTYWAPSYPDRGTDGKQEKNGNVIAYVISGTSEVDTSSQGVTNTLDEMKEDLRKISLDINEFNKVVNVVTSFTYKGTSYSGILVFPPNYRLPEGQKVFVPFSNFSNFFDAPFRRVYMTISDDIVDSKKYETFKNAMIGNILSNPSILGDATNGPLLTEQFDAYWLRIAKPAFDNENEITKEFINYMEKEKLQNFLKYTPFTSKQRLFTYTNQNANDDGRVELIKGLGAVENQNTNDKTWNDQTLANVYISKAKFN
jgi:hypothetical protein